mgnify:CR=1 FL=1
MRVSVFGLGYVGTVTSACLAHHGHEVVGVDVNSLKVEQLARSSSPVLEPGLDELIAEATGAGRLRATCDVANAIAATDLSLVCVGTPSNGNGSLDLSYVKRVVREIGRELAQKDSYHVVVIRSTVLPGTVETVLRPALEEASGKRAGVHFGLAVNPEFLREGSAIRDYLRPGQVVVGQLDEPSGDAVRSLYSRVEAPFITLDIPSAEILKYANNAFHALKVAFANEIGSIAKAHGVDGVKVMDALCQDTRLNISPAYLRPGFAFGGSCLPKDTRALAYRAKELDLDLPLLQSLLPSNERHLQKGIGLVQARGRTRVGVLGLSFKQGTDDLRESPSVILVETLLGKGFEVTVFDETVELARLTGTNREYLDREAPHIACRLREDITEVVEQSEVVVITRDDPRFTGVPQTLREDQLLVDLAGVAKDGEVRSGYEGICW